MERCPTQADPPRWSVSRRRKSSATGGFGPKIGCPGRLDFRAQASVDDRKPE
ncbi:MAG: hypothetical protein ACQESR_13975 [Planctomycetota bacterium]